MVDCLQNKLKNMEEQNPSVEYFDSNREVKRLNRTLFDKVVQFYKDGEWSKVFPVSQDGSIGCELDDCELLDDQEKGRLLKIFMRSRTKKEFETNMDILHIVPKKVVCSDEDLDLYGKVLLRNVAENAYKSLVSENIVYNLSDSYVASLNPLSFSDYDRMHSSNVFISMGRIRTSRETDKAFNSLEQSVLEKYVTDPLCFFSVDIKDFLVDSCKVVRDSLMNLLDKKEIEKYSEHPDGHHSFSDLWYGIKEGIFTEKELSEIRDKVDSSFYEGLESYVSKDDENRLRERVKYSFDL